MPDLSVDQTPTTDQLVNAVGDLSAPDSYVPPRSGTFRTSKYPGFWTAGQTPSINPNPVAGDDPVAKAPTGDDPNAAASSAPSGLSSVTSNPIGTDGGGTSVDERASSFEQTAKQAGEVTDPYDALKAANLASSFTGPLGLAGLAVSSGAAAAGLNPTGNPWDLKSNTNLRPGYSSTFDVALDTAHKNHLSGPQAAQAALDSAKIGANFQSEAGAFGVHRGIGTTPTPQDVTAANKETGFQGSPTPAAPTSKPGVVSAPAPKNSGFNANGGNPGAGFGGHSNDISGKGAPAGSEHGGYGSSYNKGGVVTKHAMKPHHKAAAHKNHQTLKQVAARAGKTVPAIVAMHKNAAGDLGARARLEAHVMKLACGGVARKAEGGVMTADPSSDPQYNPPPTQTEGNSDTVPAVLTPGETVITKDASTQYDPEVKAALNDPAMADQINALIEQFLADQGDQGADDGDGQDPEDAADSTDDASQGDEGDDASGLGTMAPMRGIPAPKSKLASITRAA